MNHAEEILKKAAGRRRITDKDALRLFAEADLLELGQCAQACAAVFHPYDSVTFIIDRNINYTNICTSRCRFCAFDPGRVQPGRVPSEPGANHGKGGGSGFPRRYPDHAAEGGLHPSLSLDYILSLLREIKERFSVCIHSFSPPEISHFAQRSGLDVPEILSRLREAGLDSLPGGGAEILSDRVRDIASPCKIKSGEWLSIMEAAHGQGMKSTATMVIGNIETKEERIGHLRCIRHLQDKTGDSGRSFPGVSRLRTRSSRAGKFQPLTISGPLLSRASIWDNIENIQGSWVTQGPDIGQIALHFGANDLGSIMLEENVVRAAGASYCLTEEEMVSLIRRAGKTPAQRNTEYAIIKRYP